MSNGLGTAVLRLRSCSSQGFINTLKKDRGDRTVGSTNAYHIYTYEYMDICAAFLQVWVSVCCHGESASASRFGEVAQWGAHEVRGGLQREQAS